MEDLYDFFKNVNFAENNDDSTDQYNNDIIQNDDINNFINNTISENEIDIAIKSLRNNKASGTDSIVNEHIKSTYHLMKRIYL